MLCYNSDVWPPTLQIEAQLRARMPISMREIVAAHSSAAQQAREAFEAHVERGVDALRARQTAPIGGSCTRDCSVFSLECVSLCTMPGCLLPQISCLPSARNAQVSLHDMARPVTQHQPQHHPPPLASCKTLLRLNHPRSVSCKREATQAACLIPPSLARKLLGAGRWT